MWSVEWITFLILLEGDIFYLKTLCSYFYHAWLGDLQNFFMFLVMEEVVAAPLPVPQIGQIDVKSCFVIPNSRKEVLT